VSSLPAPGPLFEIVEPAVYQMLRARSGAVSWRCASPSERQGGTSRGGRFLRPLLFGVPPLEAGALAAAALALLAAALLASALPGLRVRRIDPVATLRVG
jgi:hypothetical protein